MDWFSSGGTHGFVSASDPSADFYWAVSWELGSDTTTVFTAAALGGREGTRIRGSYVRVYLCYCIFGLVYVREMFISVCVCLSAGVWETDLMFVELYAWMWLLPVCVCV